MSLKPLVTNTHNNLNSISLEGNLRPGHLKLIKGQNDSTGVLPLSTNINGQTNTGRPKDNQYLTEEQARHVYKKVESGSIINADILQQEMEQERDLSRIDDTSRDLNPYKEVIVNKAEKIEPILTEMEQWSTLSNTLNYIQYDRHPKNFHSLNISAANNYRKSPCTKEEEEQDWLELDFGQTLDMLREEYLDVNEGIWSEILSTTRFDENSDLSTTYLEKADRSKNNKFKAEESFPISEQGYTMGKLLDGTECQILLDTGACKSLMSKSYYMHCKSLHSLPKFASKTKNTSGQWSISHCSIHNLCDSRYTWT